MPVKMYMKKPIPVEAIEFVFSDEGYRELTLFCGDALGDVYKARRPDAKAEAELKTLEDGKYLTVKHIATEGDFIIKGPHGEFWAVKPNIFNDTYELVGEAGQDGARPFTPCTCRCHWDGKTVRHASRCCQHTYAKYIDITGLFDDRRYADLLKAEELDL